MNATGYIIQNSPEWHAAWARLINLTGGDKAANDPERWQYMCSVYDAMGWWHEFRHRAVLGAGRCYVRVEASRNFVPENEPYSEEDEFEDVPF